MNDDSIKDYAILVNYIDKEIEVLEERIEYFKAFRRFHERMNRD